MTAKTKSDFITQIEQLKAMSHDELRDDLDREFGMSPLGIACPVPGCSDGGEYTRWGDMFEHFVKGTDNHKRAYFDAYRKVTGHSFCPGDSRVEFRHALRAILLGLIKQPVSPEGVVSAAPAKAPKRSKPVKIKPVQEQQPLLAEMAPVPQVVEKVETAPAPVKKESGPSAFSRLSEYIRNSHEINIIWRGREWDRFVGKSGGFPKCFHCQANEANQIHHQNPIFRDVVLISLKSLDLTAEDLMRQYDMSGNSVILKPIVDKVFDFHMNGLVSSAPYCRRCNQDAEIKRRAGKTE